ncbi:MAG: peptidoglycan-binding domain-containing protein [Sedimenticolaceae bacterium]
MNKKMKLGIAAAAISAVLGGCTSTQPKGDLASRLATAEKENSELRSNVAGLEQSISSRDQRIASLQGQGGSDSLLPPAAKPGECYARAFVEPQYKPVSKTVLKREAGERVETTPASYEWVEQRVLAQEASQQLKVIPAKYGWKEEEVLVKEASTQLIEQPAVYENVEEKVLVRDAYTTWKRGRGPIERIDNATGEIMCLIEVPAQYQTVIKKVVKTPASVREVALPAEYKTVKRRVVVEPAKTVTVDIPEQYKTVKVRKLVQKASERRIEIPAEYQDVSDKVLVSEGHLEWRPILCETNTSPDIVRTVQMALRNAGHNPGAVDGVLGRSTMDAVTSYQKANGLASGQLTIKTLRSLKVI